MDARILSWMPLIYPLIRTAIPLNYPRIMTEYQESVVVFEDKTDHNTRGAFQKHEEVN